jgi:hypothetical protein
MYGGVNGLLLPRRGSGINRDIPPMLPTTCPDLFGGTPYPEVCVCGCVCVFPCGNKDRTPNSLTISHELDAGREGGM